MLAIPKPKSGKKITKAAVARALADIKHLPPATQAQLADEFLTSARAHALSAAGKAMLVELAKRRANGAPSVVTVHAAKTHLSQLLARVEAGEEVIIARDTTPVAKLVALTPPKPTPRFGALAGKARVTAAFFEPLPDDELEGWDL